VTKNQLKWPYWVIGIGAVALLVSIGLLGTIANGQGGDARAASPSVSSTPTSSSLPAPPPSGNSTPALGVYAGPGDPAAVASFASAVGVPPTFVLDYLDGSSWSTIADPDWIVSKWKGVSYTMMFSVPMLARGSTLAEGATGQFDPMFVQLAAKLVAEGFGSSWLLIGPDPNDANVPWSVDSTTAAAEYVGTWRQIVNSMRSVAGQKFHFVWDTAPLSKGLSPQAVYPGNSYVDSVATDAFDADPGAATAAQRWTAMLAGPYGLTWFAAFATSQGQPFLLAKWSIVPTTAPGGGGDDPTFVHDLLNWSRANRVKVLMTWNYGTWAITGGSFPHALAALRQGVGQ
jgi:hypothetical protein